MPILNNVSVNGFYRNAEGVKSGDVWSKRSPWVALRAERFIGNDIDDANAMLSREYRAPYLLPEIV